LPGSGAVRSFVAAGYFASDNGGPQLAFGQIIGRIDAIVIQKGEEMIALFIEPIAHGFFVGFAVGRLQQLNIERPRTILIPWRAREEPLASASA
jgi:hypothetical protein